MFATLTCLTQRKKGNEDCGAVLAMVGPRKLGDTRMHEDRRDCSLRLQWIESQMTQIGGINTDWIAALCLQCSTQRMGGKGGKRKIVRYAHLFNTEEGGREVKEGKKGNEDCSAVLAMFNTEDGRLRS